MANDINQKLGEILKGLDSKKVDAGKKTVENLLKTPEGKKLQQQLQGADTDQLLKNFMQMDTEEIKKMLNKADLSGLSGISIDDVLKKLR